MNENQLFMLNLVKTDPGIKELADEICRRHGYKTPYEIDYRMFYNENREYDVIISPGNPVIITFNDSYILECTSGHRSPSYFRNRLRQSLDHMHHMHRTLRHPIPLSIAKALKKEAKRFIRIPAPLFEDKILHSKYLSIMYQITVTDKLTGTTITIHGENPEQIKKEAVQRISRTIYDEEELMDLYEKEEFKPEQHPSQIKIGGQDGEFRETREY